MALNLALLKTDQAVSYYSTSHALTEILQHNMYQRYATEQLTPIAHRRPPESMKATAGGRR